MEEDTSLKIEKLLRQLGAAGASLSIADDLLASEPLKQPHGTKGGEERCSHHDGDDGLCAKKDQGLCGGSHSQEVF